MLWFTLHEVRDWLRVLECRGPWRKDWDLFFVVTPDMRTKEREKREEEKNTKTETKNEKEKKKITDNNREQQQCVKTYGLSCFFFQNILFFIILLFFLYEFARASHAHTHTHAFVCTEWEREGELRIERMVNESASVREGKKEKERGVRAFQVMWGGKTESEREILVSGYGITNIKMEVRERLGERQF